MSKAHMHIIHEALQYETDSSWMIGYNEILKMQDDIEVMKELLNGMEEQERKAAGYQVQSKSFSFFDHQEHCNEKIEEARTAHRRKVIAFKQLVQKVSI